MKRPTYIVRIDGQPVARKHAWNSAFRAMRDEVRGLLAPGESASHETLSTVERDKWTRESGHFRWTTDTGRTFEATIELETPSPASV